MPVPFDGPGGEVSDPRELLLGYLDWYRETLMRKVAGLSTESILDSYHEEVRRSRALVAGAILSQPARIGGRFPAPDDAPSLGRILFHLLQEYARHVGHLDIARELIDGETGE